MPSVTYTANPFWLSGLRTTAVSGTTITFAFGCPPPSVIEAIIPAFKSFRGLSILTSTEYTRLFGSAAAEIDVTCPEKTSRQRFGASPICGLPSLTCRHRRIRYAEHRLHRARVGQREAVGCRTHQRADIDIALQHPRIEGGPQLAIAQRNLRFADLCLRSWPPPPSSSHLRSRIVVVRLGGAPSCIERRDAVERQLGPLVLRLRRRQ